MNANDILERYKRLLDYQIKQYYNIDFIMCCQKAGVTPDVFREMKGQLKGLKFAREMLEKIEAEEKELSDYECDQ